MVSDNLRPKIASTCCPIGLDHTKADEVEVDGDDVDRGGNSGRFP